jgi:hypothetical protein
MLWDTERKTPIQSRVRSVWAKIQDKFKNVRPHLPNSLPPYLVTLIERSWNSDAKKGQLSHTFALSWGISKLFWWEVHPSSPRLMSLCKCQWTSKCRSCFQHSSPAPFMGWRVTLSPCVQLSLPQALSSSYSLLQLQSLSHLDLSNF